MMTHCDFNFKFVEPECLTVPTWLIEGYLNNPVMLTASKYTTDHLAVREMILDNNPDLRALIAQLEKGNDHEGY